MRHRNFTGDLAPKASNFSGARGVPARCHDTPDGIPSLHVSNYYVRYGLQRVHSLRNYRRIFAHLPRADVGTHLTLIGLRGPFEGEQLGKI